ncbi:MAG: hypothetical protein B6I29_04910 [Marinitoga sp. 4572_148]|nr:MAG: hypothetical protein B6I29_04910 [Marinitoga sp. 4572_148]
MEGWIPTKRLLKITEFADKFCGKVEPMHRYIYLYFDKVLRVSMTDGCAIADIYFSKEFFPFKNIYKISIQHLKGLLKGLKEEKTPFVRMLALDEGLKVELDDVTLNIESENDEKPEIILKNPELITNINLKKYIANLDFCSVQSLEGDLINIVSDNDYEFWGYFEGYNMITYSHFGRSKIKFSMEIPYVTVRHIIKSLSLLTEERIGLYLNENSIFIKGKGIKINICGAINPVISNIKPAINPLESKKINLKTLRDILNKTYTSLPANVRVFLILGKESYILAKDKNTTLTWKINLKFNHNYLAEINHRKLRSILSRLNDNVFIELNEKKIMIHDKSRYLEIKVKEFSN